MKKAFWLLIALGIGALPFLPEPVSDTVGGWATFLGRFHILLLHFPVVLVLTLSVLEFSNSLWRKMTPDRLLNGLWGVTLMSCVFTVLAGYLLYLSGDYQGVLIRNHLWGGVLLTLFLGFSAFLRFRSELSSFTYRKPLYLGLLGLATAAVLYTSHQGGSLTHGPEFLKEYAPTFRPLPPSAAEQKPPEELLVFQDLIMPALDNRCLSCHNEHKTKGELLMTSFADLSKGGESGKPMLVAGQPEASELYVRISLPADDDDHMPPSEKPALSEDEIALIEWWIEAGGDPEMKLGQGPDTPDGKALIDRYLPTLFRAQRLEARKDQELEKLAAELEELGEREGLVIEPDDQAPGFFAVSMTMPPQVVNDGTIAKLMPYAEVFSKISLPGAVVSDDGLYELSKMSNLQYLYLPKTCIKGPGLVYLENLPDLKGLNLSYSLLDDAGALRLMHLAQLEKIFIFGTEVKPNILEALRKNLPEVTILESEGEYF